jgi:hypothetical protein
MSFLFVTLFSNLNVFVRLNGRGWDYGSSMLDREDFSRKGAKAQRKLFRNAAALCAFAGEIFSEKILFGRVM